MKKRILYPMPGERWQHYKGGVYEIITLANHSETQEAMVIYKSIPFGSVYARPLSMWQDVCEIDGVEFPRFQKL
jgi:hypothetical protein